MPESMNIDPAVLRQLAIQHEQVADDTRKWAERPQAWLDSFLDTYGPIAQPVFDALNRYYDARKLAGDKLAADHDGTAKALRESAHALETADDESGSYIRAGGGALGDHRDPVNNPLHHLLGGAGAPKPDSIPVGPADHQSPLNGHDQGNGIAAPLLPNGVPSAATDGGHPPAGADDTVAGPPARTEDADGVVATHGAVPTEDHAAPPVSGVLPPGSVAPVAPIGQPITGGPDTGGQAGSTTVDPVPPPLPVPTPFAAAVAAAKDKQAESAHAIGDEVNDDLIVARTLLGGVLAAVDSPFGMAWAVAVLRGPGGAAVFITSNEGRGWLPAGLFLPRMVSTPWLWDELLGEDDAARWEGVSDPARVLAEFGLVWGPKANARLSALASSGPIGAGLRTRFGEAAMADMVGPSLDVDLRNATDDTTDRLGLIGSADMLDHVAETADSAIRGACVELALDVHARLARTGSSPVPGAESRRLRDRILAMAQAGQPVPEQWWEELRDSDGLLVASMLSQRIDAGQIGLGELRIADEGSALRALVFERRCNELVLLLAGETTRQTLRDAVYAYEQIVGHPQFVAVPVAVSVPQTVSVTEADRTDEDTPVSAPGALAAPQPGAISAPSSAPPPGMSVDS
ncbi:type VII secretion target [Nocardia sp. NPDC006044]|uniref:type VII secretion target n=1 Tax=Nocardia sp. NPDC006044 TaxID=3364306 RepID=UPI0036C134F4